MKNIVVAFGGRSPEHEVSVLTAMQAIAALKETEYNIVPLYVSKSGRWFTGNYLMDLEHYQNLGDLQENAISCSFSHDDLGNAVLLETEKTGFFSSPEKHAIHALIPAFHGAEGENGAFQGLCEMYQIAYAGSGIFASAISMDKVKTKELCRLYDVSVVPEVCFNEPIWNEEQQSFLSKIKELGYPVVVKPVSLGSSIGVQKASNESEAVEAIESAFRYDEYVLVEKAVIPLMEINCSVLGNSDEARASVCEQPIAKKETLSFTDKYQNDEGGSKGMAAADRIIPAEISEEQRKIIQEKALQIFSIFQAAGVARLDFLINKDSGKIYFNEMNTIPGSFSFYLWEEEGMEMKELMLQLIEIALKEHGKKAGRIRSYNTNLLSEKAVRGIKGLKGKQD